MPLGSMMPNVLLGLLGGQGLFGGPVTDDLGGGLMSDEEMKKAKEEEDGKVASFLDALTSYEYEYKNPSHGKGKKFGVMAQDLEKSKVGQTMVRDTDAGKMIDTIQSVGPTLAALGYIHKRLKALEGKKNG